METLVLSATYEPVARVSWQRAITLIWTGRAEVIEEYPADKYSPSCLLLGFTAETRPLHIQVSDPSRPIIKVITTVAILAAVYIFIVKPTLDTTNSAFDSFSDSFDGFDNLPADIQSRIDDAFDSSSDTDRLQDCIDRAIQGNDVNQNALDRCVERLGD